MKRTAITVDLAQYPTAYHSLLCDASVYDSSCSPEARVIYVEKDGGYYLKTAPKGSLRQEAELTAWFSRKGLAAQVLDYRSETSDWLLTTRVPGEDATDACYLAEPKRLAVTMATLLRTLHEVEAHDCPVPDRMASYCQTVEKNYRAGGGDISLFSGCWGVTTVEEAWEIYENGKESLRSEVLLHGDYCLPNVILDNWRFRGFIDLGNGGVGDRHVDIFWGLWTLQFNLHTDRFNSDFLDAYGRDRVERDKLALIAAAEVFG